MTLDKPPAPFISNPIRDAHAQAVVEAYKAVDATLAACRALERDGASLAEKLRAQALHWEALAAVAVAREAPEEE